MYRLKVTSTEKQFIREWVNYVFGYCTVPVLAEQWTN